MTFFGIVGLSTLALALFVVYMLPTGVAIVRKARDLNQIAVLNLLAGWTAAGWVVAMVWAVQRQTERK